jgi:hypothetical protein
MKISATFLLLTVVLSITQMAQAADSSLELVVSDSQVAFYNATNISMGVDFRNVGETKLQVVPIPPHIIFDGKEFNHVPFIYDGVASLSPKTGVHNTVIFKDYDFPTTILTPGKHTVSLKYGDAVSNQLTIFIEPQK